MTGASWSGVVVINGRVFTELLAYGVVRVGVVLGRGEAGAGIARFGVEEGLQRTRWEVGLEGRGPGGGRMRVRAGAVCG